MKFMLEKEDPTKHYIPIYKTVRVFCKAFNGGFYDTIEAFAGYLETDKEIEIGL